MRVSIVCFGGGGHGRTIRLNGAPVNRIFPDLTANEPGGSGVDLSVARPLRENSNTAYLGIQKTGPFEVPGEVARKWLQQPNAHGLPNSNVVRPWWNGLDVTRRNRDFWIIDFGTDMAEHDAALFAAPYEYARIHVKPTRVGKREARTNEMWWIFQWPRPVMRRAIASLLRVIVTPEVAKHRVFAWLSPPTIADKNLTVIAREDDTAFGILHSRFHEVWSLRLCTWLGVGNDPRYTPTTTFETFPFPAGLTPNLKPSEYTNPHAAEIGVIAARLNELRENWLNPPEWTERVAEVVPGYPDRIVAKLGCEEKLKKRTLTNLYNERPTWLANMHRELDAAVAKAYGWTDYSEAMSDEEILGRLLKLNLERSSGTDSGMPKLATCRS